MICCYSVVKGFIFLQLAMVNSLDLKELGLD